MQQDPALDGFRAENGGGLKHVDSGVPPFFLALDAGTSSVKAALFDTMGQRLAGYAEEYRLDHPRPGYVELDPEIYWRAAKAAISGVMRQSGADPASIAAMGVTGQGETLIAVDAEGRPLRRAIVWLDHRAVDEARMIAEALDPDMIYRVTGQHEIVPCWTASKLLWLRRHEPDVFSRASRFLMVSDYILYKLTGRYATDHALNPSTLYYDLIAGDWWPPMLDLLDIRREQLPDLLVSGDCVGTLKTAEIGLSADTKVVVAPIDQIAGAVGAGNLGPGTVTETTGSVLAICAPCHGPRYDPRRRLSLYRHARPGLYAFLPWAPTAGLLYRWFRETLAAELSFDDLNREAAAIAPGADGLLILPHLNGATSPESNPRARGVFHGVSLAHTRGHFARAIMESIGFMMRDQIRMLESLDIPVERVGSLGGGARGKLWLQIKADILAREVVTYATEEVTALGVAMLAATGAGVYSDLEQAAARMVHCDRRFRPDPERTAVYDRVFERYRHLNHLVLPTFKGAL